MSILFVTIFVLIYQFAHVKVVCYSYKIGKLPNESDSQRPFRIGV